MNSCDNNEKPEQQISSFSWAPIAQAEALNQWIMLYKVCSAQATCLLPSPAAHPLLKHAPPEPAYQVPTAVTDWDDMLTCEQLVPTCFVEQGNMQNEPCAHGCGATEGFALYILQQIGAIDTLFLCLKHIKKQSAKISCTVASFTDTHGRRAPGVLDCRSEHLTVEAP